MGKSAAEIDRAVRATAGCVLKMASQGIVNSSRCGVFTRCAMRPQNQNRSLSSK